MEKTEKDTVEGAGGDAESPIMARLAALEARTVSAEKNSDRLVRLATTLATRPQPVAAPAASQADETDAFSFEGLPDPTKDAPGYAKALAKRLDETINKRVERRVGATKDQEGSAASQEKRVERLWQKFNGKYSEFKDMEDLVEVAARAEIADRVETGQTVEQAVLLDQDGFMEAVAERTRGRLTKLGVKPKAKDDEDDEDEAEKPPAGMALRTEGLAMDLGGGSPANKGSGKNAPKVESYIDSIKAQQKKLGMF